MVKMLDVPCPKCSWKFQGFHICTIDMSTPKGVRAATRIVEPKSDKNKQKRSNRLHQADAGSEEARRRIAEGVSRARATEPGRRERDAEIIRLYDEMHNSITRTAALTGLDYRTVRKVLHAAAARGDIVLRVDTGGRPRQAVG